jgi:hypothetical protein
MEQFITQICSFISQCEGELSGRERGRERGGAVRCMEDAYPILQRWWEYILKLEPLQSFKKGTYTHINICKHMNKYIYMHKFTYVYVYMCIYT